MFYGDIHSVSCGVRSHSLEHNKLDKAQDTVSRKWGGGVVLTAFSVRRYDYGSSFYYS